eukprot:TRINITY_DN30263_c0_g1_i1.p1 TRINITY_DN30263_c0_g1~~TRINITY_DN30263_c0_g1_i1.p1  ORF type:complete len:821 (+),score=161.70 TRINITY_DN30263_c0_g1_i1:30-2492(+)
MAASLDYHPSVQDHGLSERLPGWPTSGEATASCALSARFERSGQLAAINEQPFASPRTSRNHPGCMTPTPAVRGSPFKGSYQRVDSPRGRRRGPPWAAATPLPASTRLAWELSRPATSMDTQSGMRQYAGSPDLPDRSGAASAPPVFSTSRAEDSLLFGSSANDDTVGESWFGSPTSSMMQYSRAIPPEMAQSLQLLKRHHALWPAELHKQLRQQAVKRLDPDEAHCLRGVLNQMHKCVKDGTDLAFEKGFYQVYSPAAPGFQTKYLTDVCCASTVVTWFNDSTTTAVPIPQTGDPREQQASPPPLMVVKDSCLDVVEKLRKLGHEEKRIFVVAELIDFDKAGVAACQKATSIRPHCLPVRGDFFHRFCKEADRLLQIGKSTMQGALCSEQDPLAFLSSDVTIFRGPQSEGYPFLQEPFTCQVISVALWTARPMIKNFTTPDGKSLCFYVRSADDIKYAARLNLAAKIALTASKVGTEALPNGKKPILVLPALGLEDNTFHPQDSAVDVLVSFRRRFSGLFHSIYIACGDRGPNINLAEYLDHAVNQDLHRIAESADPSPYEVLPWHWDKRELRIMRAYNMELVSAAIKEHKLTSQRCSTPAATPQQDRSPDEELQEKTSPNIAFSSVKLLRQVGGVSDKHGYLMEAKNQWDKCQTGESEKYLQKRTEKMDNLLTCMKNVDASKKRLQEDMIRDQRIKFFGLQSYRQQSQSQQTRKEQSLEKEKKEPDVGGDDVDKMVQDTARIQEKRVSFVQLNYAQGTSVTALGGGTSLLSKFKQQHKHVRKLERERLRRRTLVKEKGEDAFFTPQVSPQGSSAAAPE